MPEDKPPERMIGNKTASEHALDGRLMIDSILLGIVALSLWQGGLLQRWWQAIEGGDWVQAVVDSVVLGVCVLIVFRFLQTSSNWFIAYLRRRRRSI